MLPRLTHRVTGQARSIEWRLWVDTMMADNIPHTGDDQNQTIRGRFQKIMQVLRELGMEKLARDLVNIAGPDLFIVRIHKWPNLRMGSTCSVGAPQIALTKRSTPGFCVIRPLNRADHGLNRRSES
jgi:hypothetical protein